MDFPENYNATLQLEREIDADTKRVLIKRHATEGDKEWEYAWNKRGVVIGDDGTVTVPPIEYCSDLD